MLPSFVVAYSAGKPEALFVGMDAGKAKEVYSANVENPNLMASVAPVTRMRTVFAPVDGFFRYHISVAILTLVVVDILVSETPLKVAVVTVPVPPTSCQISA